MTDIEDVDAFLRLSSVKKGWQGKFFKKLSPFTSLPDYSKLYHYNYDKVYGNHFLEGITTIKGTPSARKVVLYKQFSESKSKEPVRLVKLSEMMSSEQGYWKFEKLHPKFLYTIKAFDTESVYNPLIRKDLRPIKEE